MEEGGVRQQKRPVVVLISCPLQGHIAPVLQLASALHARGISITIPHSKLNPPDPSKYPHFVFAPLSDNTPPADSFPNFIEFLRGVNKNCTAPFHQLLSQMIDERKGKSESESITVVHDNLMFFAADVAGDLNLPAIIFRCASAAFLPAFLALPKLHQEGRFPVQGPMLHEIVPELQPLRYKDLPFVNLPIQAALELHVLFRTKTHSTAIISNTVDFLEHQALSQIHDHYKVPVFAVGPLHRIAPSPSTSFLEEDASCIPWLNKQAPKSVIYVSLGSLATMDEKVLAEMAWGLANSTQPFLWVVRPGSVRGSKWIEFLPEVLMDEMRRRGLIVKWSPQKEVLAHSAVGGFWTHCGWNSTLESICEGVPMLCQPFSTDQGVNARYISYVWKIGIELEHLERGAIDGAVRKLLLGKEGEEMRNNIIAVKENVEAAERQGGSSQKSLNDLAEFISSI